ncbi:winged helix-turn-helix domain-containing protein [Sulfurospirillum barnesii]|uniref:Response regulator with CheY-like receiver domain and winged-helix DNA-binding domain n=1 Tax=Sulfurospirillum barnesii (strain ATCC 700032 / DSM 10660 / SES-3) TaxID=760154 RepID=I3XZY3_SULBS|nr:winged helix-turn-helix domain-containing protein [Sulfurospirillum barnesii]AFL69507.1 response regulator with CheY-like receiver domain and winged-helix DNA-binding domain [Sulfurospirillum barnesii SES-3]
MKIVLLEPDKLLATRIASYLNTLRLKVDVKQLSHESELLQESSLNAYALFVLNLKDPLNPSTIKYIRENESTAPVLLILEKDPDPSLFKPLYYLGYDCVLVKDFLPEEITFSIYKLCNVWNDSIFFVTKEIYFDFQNSKFIHYNDEIMLGKKEALLLKHLFLKSPSIVSFNEIASYVYHDEIVSEERMRSLVRQLRAKMPLHLIETIKGEGYKIMTHPIA